MFVLDLSELSYIFRVIETTDTSIEIGFEFSYSTIRDSKMEIIGNIITVNNYSDYEWCIEEILDDNEYPEYYL